MKRLLYLSILGGALLSIACKKTKSPDEKKEEPGENQSVFIIDSTFTNPVLTGGADPWIIQKNGTYYCTYTQGSKLVLLAAKNVSELASATRYEVWTPPAGTMYSKNVWAPELHEINGKWYFYFAADDGPNANHRMYVVENTSSNPTEGTWEFKGQVADATNQWAIDGTILNYKGKLYMLWSGAHTGTAPQNIYIAEMSNPWTISSQRVMIAAPTYDWEKKGNAINEGPQALLNPQGRLFVIYSGSGFWEDGYCLGQLTLKENGDPMNAADWTKKATPVFSMRAGSSAYGPGHNGFFKSPDGKEDWIIYHARGVPNGGDAVARTPRIQRFTWNADGSPNFGEPEPLELTLRRPSGEPIRLIYTKTKWSIPGFSSEEINNSRLATRLIDNSLSTYWITRYSTDPTDYPSHWISVDMDTTASVDGFIISQKAGDRKIKELEIQISTNNNTWESVGVYTLNNIDLLKQYVSLPQQKQCRYFKLIPVSGHDAQKQPGLAEVSAFRFKN
jgi:GH43 family beta-xylosidase